MPRPSNERWESLKSEIHHLYLEQDLRLAQVKRILEQRFNHEASIRMYKSRLRNWGFQVKNVKSVSWQAMAAIAKERKDQGMRTIFFEIIGARITGPISETAIQKHFRRDRHTPPSTAHQALIRVPQHISIVWTTPPPSPAPLTSRRLQLPAMSGPLRHRHIPAALVYGEPGHRSPSLESGRLTPISSDDDRLDDDGPDDDGPVVFSEPESQFYSSSDSSMESLVDDFRGLALKILEPKPPEHKIHRLSKEDELCLNRLLSGGPYRRKRNTSVPRVVQRGNELAVEFGRLAQPLIVACDFAVHIFAASCWLRQGLLEKAAASKASALESFRLMLKTANGCLYTNLSCLVTILCSHGLETLLQEVLTDCCDMIDAERATLNFGPLYRYSLAVLSGNDVDKTTYGSQLKQCHEHVKMIWKDEPSSAIISGYFVAWHALDIGNSPEAISLLKDCLVQSEEKMGRSHLVTINCLSILHRAYWKCGQRDLAIKTLNHAISRCEEATGKESPYRLQLSSQLALHFREMGQPEEAEKILWEVLKDQKEFMGLLHADAHSSRIRWTIEELERVLQEQGKTEQATQFMQDIDQQRQDEWTVFVRLREQDEELGCEAGPVMRDLVMR